MSSQPENIVLLHGFGGTAHAWDAVIARLGARGHQPLALDLPGHGRHGSSAAPVTFAGCVEQVLAESPDHFLLCGYSLGGRVALHVALAAPARVDRLVLVATSAGIEDPAERRRRRLSDDELAEELETRPHDEFVERWGNQPLFAEDPAEVAELARRDQLRNRPQALAAVLRGIGAGEMDPLWDRLGELHMPVTVLAGERDAKYQELGGRLVARVEEGELRVVAGGHRLALENPDAVAEAIAP